MAERSLSAALSTRSRALRGSDRSCGSRTKKWHCRMAWRATHSLHVHIVFAVFAEAVAVRRHSSAAVAETRPAATTVAFITAFSAAVLARLRAAAGVFGWARRV